MSRSGVGTCWKTEGFSEPSSWFCEGSFLSLVLITCTKEFELEHCIRRICTDILRKHFLQKKLSCEGTASDAVWMTWYCFHCLHTYLPSKPRLQFFHENWHRILVTPVWGNSKNNGFSPNHPSLIGFSIIFTIHFVVPLFLETPISCILRSAHFLQQSTPLPDLPPNSPNSPQVS